MLHSAGAPAFGAGAARRVDACLDRPGPDGQRALPSERIAAPVWALWYAEHRITPYLRAARDAGDLTAEECALVERVCARLPALAGPAEPPARLHGDLWSGNVLWAPDGGVADRPRRPRRPPGDRPRDARAVRLPQLDTVLAAYDEAAPLADGWRERVPLHQLFPLLVHAVLFGRGYAGQTVAAARAALRAG